MRILLLQAISRMEGGELVYPLGLARIAASLKGDHTVGALDMNLHSFPWPVLRRSLEEFRPDVVGVSFRNLDPLAGMLHSFVPQLKASLTLVKRYAPRATIVLGGSGFSLFARRLMRELPDVDLGVRGEGEDVFPDLLERLDQAEGLPGVLTRAGAGQTMDSWARRSQTGRWSLPDWDLFPPGDYSARNSYVAFMGIEGKRGCPHACSYCLYPELQGRGLRLREPEVVVEEMFEAHSRFGVRLFHFTDPVVNEPAHHLDAICEEILRRDLQVGWTGFFREDALRPSCLKLYGRAGLNAIYFSADGASPEALALLNKATDMDRVIQAAGLAAASGIVTVHHFLCNLPGETARTVRHTRELVGRLCTEHRRAGNPAAFVFNNLRVLPGTALTRRLAAEGLWDARKDLLYPAYYNPPPYDGLRHELNALALEDIASFDGLERACG